MAQTIEAFVGNALDDAKISPLHIKVIALIAAGYFFDVIDLIVLGSLIPDMIATKFATGAEAGWIGSATVFGMFLGGVGQGEFSDRWGRKTVYQFNLLVFGVFTILGGLAPTVWLLVARFIAGLGLGGEQPLAFAYAGEYSPELIRGRILALVHFIGGACVWPIATFTLAFRDLIGWRGVWIVIGIGALIVWVLRFVLPRIAALSGDAWPRSRKPSMYWRKWALRGRGNAHHRRGEQHQDRPVQARLHEVPEAGDRRNDLLLGVLWRRHRPRRMAAQHHARQGLHHHQVAPVHAGHELGGALRQSVHDVGARPNWPQDHVGLCVHRRRHHGDRVRQCWQQYPVADCRFIMVFFIQVSGNSMQIFASEVFPTNARASGFGWAAGVGRLSTAGIFIAIPWIQKGWGLNAVFICIATVLVIAAIAVTQLGPEQSKGVWTTSPRQRADTRSIRTTGPGSARCRPVPPMTADNLIV